MRPDLNLLRVFDAVAEARSVTLAAERLALSQSAVSHALNRLRDVVGDPLFIRGRRRMQLSPRALSMVGPVRELLSQAELVMSDRAFDPKTSGRCFSIATSDYAVLALMPKVMSRLHKLAPNISLHCSPAGAETLAQLEEGSIDLSFWGTDPPRTPYGVQFLFREHYVGVMSARHPLAAKCRTQKMTIEHYLSYSHVTASLGVGGRNAVDQALMRRGFRRRVAVTSHSFVGNLQLLRTGNLIATLPSRICTKEYMQGLVSFELPIKVPEYDYSLCWHRRTEADDGVKWLRRQIAEGY